MSSLSIFVHEAVIVSDVIAIEIIVVTVAIRDYVSFSANEIKGLREVLRLTVGDRANQLTDEHLNEFGASMLLATAVVLKAKHLKGKVRLDAY
jgi:hypothetical protein